MKQRSLRYDLQSTNLTPRRQKRVRMKVELELATDHFKTYQGHSHDISVGGIFVTSFELQPEPGTLLSAKFMLPTQQYIELFGEVTWKREFSVQNPELPPGFGLRFYSVPPKMKKAISEYIQQKEQHYPA